MSRKSRRADNNLAAEKLQKQKVDDQDVLGVLRLWYFKQNTSRVNVFPIGVSSVNSDTLGLVRSRIGAVVPTRITL